MGSLFIIRHGQTTHNRDRVIQGPRIDADLSELGREQAIALGRVLRRVDLRTVYTSPLVRARSTAQSIVDGHPGPAGSGLAVQVVPELYEMDYGQFSGRVVDDVRDEIDQVLDAWSLGYLDHPWPGGESPVVAQHRVRPFLERAREQALAANVAVVAHGRINRVILSTLHGTGLQNMQAYPQSNASITELSVSQDGIEVLRLNDTSHLDLTAGTTAAAARPGAGGFGVGGQGGAVGAFS